MNNGRTHYADDETIAHIAKLEAELAEAVELLRDLWIVLDERAKTDAPSGVYLHLKAFLAGEEG